MVLGEQVLGKETPESTVAKVKARLAGAQVEAAVAAEAMSGAREETAAT